jgi:hypothetical protein
MVPALYFTLADRVKNHLDTFNKMSMAQKKRLLLQFIREHIVFSSFFAGILVMASGCIFLPQQGRIITMGPEMRNAFDLLSSTQTGRRLVQKASKSTRGAPIYLIRGTTGGDNMVNPKGDTVLGLTHACFKSICSQYTPNGIFIYSNKDLSGPRVDIIALTLAFEFENVVWAMHYPAMEYSTDSPEAQKALEKVALELGLIDKI